MYPNFTKLALEIYTCYCYTKTLVHAFITSRVDYCNAVVAGSGVAEVHN